MGFSELEAIVIVIGSFLLGSGIIDEVVGVTFSNIALFKTGNWIVGINTGGAVIPILISIYLIFKRKIDFMSVTIGIIIVTIITFFVTYPKPQSGIVSPFPYFLLPAIFASIVSVILLRKNFKKAAPLAYISGTIGVLIGADFLHLPELLSYTPNNTTPAIIGGAVVFDMIFITGILAVMIDSIIMFRQKRKEGFD
jgi:uncharacterized membrane protein